MRRALFVDGPWAGQWHDVPDDLRPWMVLEQTRREFTLATAHQVLYFPVRVRLSGWRIGLVVYQAHREQYLSRGTVLPGQIIGERLESCSIDAFDEWVELYRRGWTP